MEIKITDFNTPFSFYAVRNDKQFADNCSLNSREITSHHRSLTISDSDHGQYVAVLINHKWTRGIITVRENYMIWLVDEGVYLHPTESTIYIKLPNEYRKLPSKVFEASIHGVTPCDLRVTDLVENMSGTLQLTNQSSLSWTPGAVTQAKNAIEESVEQFFLPVAMLSTEYNDVVIGDLYLRVPGKGIVNIIDILESEKTYEKNEEEYFKNLTLYYKNRRIHYACPLKPNLDVEIPEITFKTSFKEFSAILENVPELDLDEDDDESDDVGTILSTIPDATSKYNLTPEERAEYSKMYIKVNGRTYNVLNCLINKIRDLAMCEKYRHYDGKSVGRAYSCRRLV